MYACTNVYTGTAFVFYLFYETVVTSILHMCAYVLMPQIMFQWNSVLFYTLFDSNTPCKKYMVYCEYELQK